MKQLTAEQKAKDHNLNQWHIVQRSPISNRIEDETGFVIAVVWHTQADIEAGLKDKTNANSQLMVTARELLAACQAMETALSEVPCISNKQEASRIQARQAIRKATGKA